MHVDISALRAIEREKDISFDTVIGAIETALLSAYRHTDGAASRARVEIDRKSGQVQVLAQEVDDDGEVTREWDDTPDDFGRIAAMTAKQVILQRLREAEQILRRFVSDVHVEEATRQLTAPAEGLGPMMRAAQAYEEVGMELDDIGLKRPSLDDVFLNLTGHRAEERRDDEALEPEEASA